MEAETLSEADEALRLSARAGEAAAAASTAAARCRGSRFIGAPAEEVAPHCARILLPELGGGAPASPRSRGPWEPQGPQGPQGRSAPMAAPRGGKCYSTRAPAPV